MTTYNTYQEAKLDNPDKDIVTTGKNWKFRNKTLVGKFSPLIGSPEGACSHIIADESWVICNPADHCMNFEDFFKAGHKFVAGDKWENPYGQVITFTTDCEKSQYPGDENRFVLSAKALEEERQKAFAENMDLLTEQVFEKTAGVIQSRTDAEGTRFISSNGDEFRVGDRVTVNGVENFPSDVPGVNGKAGIAQEFYDCPIYGFLAKIAFDEGHYWRVGIDFLKHEEAKETEQVRTKESAAIRTLEAFGYEYKGGEFWEPPVKELKEPKQVEWNGDGEVPPVGWRGLSAYTEEGGGDWTDFHDGIVMGINGDHVWMAHHGKYHRVHHISCIEYIKPETPEQKKQRELLEAAHELYNKSTGSDVSLDYFDNKMADKIVSSWVKAVEITGYRKDDK
jgi:hypothetical protein